VTAGDRTHLRPWQRSGWQVVAFLLLALSPAFLFAYLQIEQVAKASVEQALVHMDQDTERLTHHLENTLHQGQALLVGLAQNPRLQQGDAACNAALRAVHAAETAYLNFGFVDTRGRMACNALPLPQVVDMSQTAHVIQALQGQPGVSALRTSVLTGYPIVSLAHPVYAPDGRLVGAVLANLTIKQLEAVIGQLGLQPGTTVTVTNAQAEVLASYAQEPLAVGRPVPDPAMATALTAPGRARNVYTDRDGKTWLVARRALPDLPGGVQVAMHHPMDMVMAPVQKQRQQQWLALLAGAGVGLASALWLARRVWWQPVKRLTRLAERYRQGDLNGRFGGKTPGGEVGLLATTFDNMADGLQDRQAQEQRYLAELGRRNRLYAWLSTVTRSMLASGEKQAYLQRICEDAVEVGHMRLAWVGLLGADLRVRPMAMAGTGTEQLDHLQISADAHDPYGQGPTGLVLRSNSPYWGTDYATDPLTALWRTQEGVHADWGAFAVLPLHQDQRVTGVLVLYTGRGIAFEDDDRALLTTLASQVDNALQHFAEAKQLAELNHIYRDVVNTQQEMVCRFKPDTTLVFCNTAYERTFGRPGQPLLGSQWLDKVPEAVRQQAAQRLASLRRELPQVSYEEPAVLADGREAWFRWTDLALFDADGRVTEIQAWGLDITALKQAEAQAQRDNALLMAASRPLAFWVSVTKMAGSPAAVASPRASKMSVCAKGWPAMRKSRAAKAGLLIHALASASIAQRRISLVLIACGCIADQRNHIGNALGPVGGELRFEIKWRKCAFNIRRQNRSCCLILHRFQDQRDNPFGNRRIAIRQKMQRAIITRCRIHPNAGRTAADQRGVSLQGVGHVFQIAPQLNQQPIAIISVQKFIVVI